jgi:hypothetical protein
VSEVLYASERADRRQKLERLCRYIGRPAIAEQHLSLTRNGNVRYQHFWSCRIGRHPDWPFCVGLRPSVKVRYPTWVESSDVSMLGQFKRIINFDTEVSDGVLEPIASWQ